MTMFSDSELRMFSSGLRSSTIEVRQLALLDRADVAVQAEVARAVDRRGAQRLHVRHAALLQHPQLPVRAEALQLAVRAELHHAAGVGDLLRALARSGRG